MAAAATPLGVLCTLEGNMLYLRAGYQDKERCASIPGGRWNPQLCVWTYPFSPIALENITDMFGEAALSPALTLRAQQMRDEVQVDSLLFRTQHWAHQVKALERALPRPATMLAMDMSTGKTLVAISCAANWNAKRILVLCPTSVMAVWPKEFAKHSPRAYQVEVLNKGTVAAQAKRSQELVESGVPLVLVQNYEAAWRPAFSEFALQTDWDLVILDESHRIKSPRGKTAQFCHWLSSQAAYRLCLTGTPMPHSPLDIWSQYMFLDPSVFGRSYTAFESHYAITQTMRTRAYDRFGRAMSREFQVVMGFQNQEELQRRFYSIAYRVMTDEVLELPDAVHQERTFLLSPKAMRHYRELEALARTELETGALTPSNAMVKLLRLQQLTGGYLPTDAGTTEQVDNGKQKALADVLEDLPKDEPVVIFARFIRDIENIKDVCAKLERSCAQLSGGANQLAEWQEGQYTDLAVQIQTGGVGIDLTRARYAIYYSLGFLSPGDYEQSLRRTLRYGQTRSVSFIHLIAEGTVDERIYEALSQKKVVIEHVLTAIRGSANPKRKRGSAWP